MMMSKPVSFVAFSKGAKRTSSEAGLRQNNHRQAGDLVRVTSPSQVSHSSTPGKKQKDGDKLGGGGGSGGLVANENQRLNLLETQNQSHF